MPCTRCLAVSSSRADTLEEQCGEQTDGSESGDGDEEVLVAQCAW